MAHERTEGFHLGVNGYAMQGNMLVEYLDHISLLIALDAEAFIFRSEI